MKNVLKRRIAEVTTGIKGRLSLSEWKMMMMMMIMLPHIIVPKLINKLIVCIYVFSDRGHRQTADHLCISFANDILLPTASNELIVSIYLVFEMSTATAVLASAATEASSVATAMMR